MRKHLRFKRWWHRASYVFVENNQNEFLVQQTSMSSDNYQPGSLNLATGRALKWDEADDLNAQAALATELGLKQELQDIIYIGQRPFTDDEGRADQSKARLWGNVFYTKLDTDGRDLKFIEAEVEGLKFMTKDEIIEFIDAESEERYAGPRARSDSATMFKYLLENLGEVQKNRPPGTFGHSLTDKTLIRTNRNPFGKHSVCSIDDSLDGGRSKSTVEHQADHLVFRGEVHGSQCGFCETKTLLNP